MKRMIQWSNRELHVFQHMEGPGQLGEAANGLLQSNMHWFENWAGLNVQTQDINDACGKKKEGIPTEKSGLKDYLPSYT